ncbi:MAG: uncharacterized protein A8A55_3193 [Amphiamblys sp. WSBS2006]|nr:MAG: uncharacterized protein A8A55_3193 [Amphiamblys sp. WSBS2006]
MFLVRARKRLCRGSGTLPRWTGVMRSREKCMEKIRVRNAQKARTIQEHKPEAAGTLRKLRRDPEGTRLFRVHRQFFGWSLGAAGDTGKYSLSETVFSPDEKSAGNTQSFASDAEQTEKTAVVLRKSLCCLGICLQHAQSRLSPLCCKGCESPTVDTHGGSDEKHADKRRCLKRTTALHNTQKRKTNTDTTLKKNIRRRISLPSQNLVFGVPKTSF